MSVDRIRKVGKALFQPGNTLSQRASRGSAWVTALQIVQRAMGLARTIILARLLAPSDFGLMGIALLTIGLLDIFTDTGFEAALIQKKEDIPDYLDAAWTLLVLRGVALAAILFLAAPLVALLFRSPEAATIIRVIALAPLLKGLINIGLVRWRRELDFGKCFLYETSKTSAEIAVSLLMAFVLRSVWALVCGYLAGVVIQLLVSYWAHPYRPRLSLEVDKLRELFNFGKWVLASNIVVYMLIQGDNAFAGSFLGATALGLYQMAYQISNLPATQVTGIVGQVAFPAYSRLQEDIPRLRSAFLRALQLIAFLSVPMAAGLFMLAPDVTRIVLGSKWEPMVPAMQALVLFGLVRSLIASAGPIYQAAGRPDIDAKFGAIKVAIQFALFYPLAIRWGILGVALAVVVPNALLSPIAYWLVIRIIHCKVAELLKMISVPFLGVAVMSAAIWGAKGLVGTENLPGLSLAVLVGSATYLLTVYLLDRPLGYGLFKNIGDRLRALAVVS